MKKLIRMNQKYNKNSFSLRSLKCFFVSGRVEKVYRKTIDEFDIMDFKSGKKEKKRMKTKLKKK